MSGRGPRLISVNNDTKVGTLPVGSTVKLNLNGTPWDWLVVHQGLPSSMYDESCNGTWLLLKDCYEERAWNSSDTNKLESSTIHSYLNSTFLNLFDSNINEVIKQVKIPYRSGGGTGGTDQSGTNGLPCKIFLLSGYEVGWTNNVSSFPVDGAKLDYFESGTGTSANNKRIASYNGSTTLWRLRSPDTSTTARVWYVRVDGSYSCVSYASNPQGVRPAIILPSSFRISPDLITEAVA